MDKMHWIVRSQIRPVDKFEDYVRTDDLEGALECAKRLVSTGGCYAARVHEDNMGYKLVAEEVTRG